MLFTVFQYVPILEEEIHASKTMSKKSNTASPEQDGADDDSGDDDEGDSDEFFNHSNYQNFKLSLSGTGFTAIPESYISLISSINTPPPKI